MLTRLAILSTAMLIVVLGPSPGAGEDRLAEQIIKRELITIESREFRRSSTQNKASALQLKQDKRVAERRLRSLELTRPRNKSLPILKRQLDRIRR